jgi:glutathione S-transferase/GST-like protein
MLELYHWEPNTYFLKPLIALNEKQVPFTSRWFDPTAFEQFADAFPRNTETGLHLEREGPVLVHDGAIISSSFFMLEYIAEAFTGTDLSAGDASQHYRARSWGQTLGAVGAGVSMLGCMKYLAPVLKKQSPDALKSRLDSVEPLERRLAWSAVVDGTYDDKALAGAREKLKFSVKRVEDTLSRTTWLAGPAYSVADIDAFSLLFSLPGLAPDVVSEKDTPRIVEFLHRMKERKAVKESLALSRSGKPHEAFIPGAEPSRWG